MAERPPIPAELRRSILVEAGHRCAIPTCRHTADVDVHHIVPWATVKEHTHDNLIALCPNCHRRADAEEIDRKSLRIYKERLQASVPGLSDASHQGELSWELKSIQQSGTAGRSFEVHVEFPVFTGANSEPVNAIESGFAWKSVADRLVSASSVLTLDERIISIRSSHSVYVNGAAHGLQRTTTRNYLRDGMMLLDLRHLATDLGAMMHTMSDYAVAALKAEQGDSADESWIRKGAGPRPENFANWNLTPIGLRGQRRRWLASAITMTE